MFYRPSIQASNIWRQRLLVGGVSILVGVLLVIYSGNTFVQTMLFSESTDMLEGAIDGRPVFRAPAYQPPQPPVLINNSLETLSLSAAGILVRDVETNTILYTSQAETVRSVASITKLLTALTLLDVGMDWSAEGRVVSDTGLFDNHMYAGDTYSTEDLWLAMLVASSNKAAMTLVDMVAPSREQFIARMNELAVSYGMNNSTFVEPTGLHAGNVSTPKDISVLLDMALSVPPIREGLRTTEHRIERPAKRDTHHMWNTNWLLIDWIPNNLYQVIGGKTGYIDASLYNFTARIVTIDGYILDVVVFGAPTHEARFTVARDAIMAVLGAYDWHAAAKQVTLEE
jgi:D-alanyl-D-alanine endopeptidase (penicillin-binding protein 7)